MLFKKAHSFEDVSDPKTREKLRAELDKRIQNRQNGELTNKPHSNGLVMSDVYSAKVPLTKMARQDSGVSSSCSCLPTPSASAPDTPLFVEHTCREFQFQYPSSPSLPTILTPPEASSSADSVSREKVSSYSVFKFMPGLGLRCSFQTAAFLIQI